MASSAWTQVKSLEVPFISSGAMSRRHYSVVRKIETASSAQAADEVVWNEVTSIKEKLAQTSLALNECREYLLILLYCAMSLTSDARTSGAFNFALPYALNLAEAGRSMQNKRVGYLFCAESMPPEHELKLMLVNTLRKDLESQDIARMCLALDNLISSPNRYVTPVQSLILDLMSHKYPLVRRRAALALRNVSWYDPELRRRLANGVMRHLRDSDQTIVYTALGIVGTLTLDVDQLKARTITNNLLDGADFRSPSSVWYLLRILQALSSLGLTDANLHVALDLIRASAKFQLPAVILAMFRLLSQFRSDVLSSAERSPNTTLVDTVRQFLASYKPNDQYLFISCLSCIEPVLWAGMSAEHPALLDHWEMERVMQLLDSPDPLIRKMTLQMLRKMDPGIVTTRLSQVLNNIPGNVSIPDLNETARRLLEIVDVDSICDGGQYARHICDIFTSKALLGLEHRHVIEPAVEMVLDRIRSSESEFQIACVTTFLTRLTELDRIQEPTLVVIMSALATEHCGRSFIPPNSLLLGLAVCLKECTPAVQDTCLLAMLRLSAECDGIPTSVLEAIEAVQNVGGRYIRQRCHEFLSLCNQQKILRDIVGGCRSPSLPDFLHSVQRYLSQASRPGLLDSSTDLPDKGLVLPSSTHIPPYSIPNMDGSDLNEQKIDLGQRQKVASESEDTGNLTSKLDLISLASPSHSASGENDGDLEQARGYEEMWNSLPETYSARGWCDDTMAGVIRRLRNLGPSGWALKIIPVPVAPFVGEVMVIIDAASTDTPNAVVRLRESDEASCLWRLRCTDADLRRAIRRMLDN